jgi:uncharacterized protein YjiS (DUF1127 family)
MKATFANRSMIPVTSAAGAHAVRSTAGLGSVSSAIASFAHNLDRRADHLVERMFTWQRRIADRRSLESLDDRMLQDIGLTRGDVFVEASKPFWKQ